MSNQTSSVSAARDVSIGKSSTTSNISGSTPRITPSHITSGASENTSGGSAPKAITPNIVNPIATAVRDSNTGGASSATPNLNPRHTQAGNTATNTRAAVGADVSPATGGHGGGATDVQVNNSVSESTKSKVETEKSIQSRATATEQHEPAAFKAPAPIHNISSPAPPSAGVVDQIAGHKRSLDEGPGSANAEQPEPKRLSVHPS
ncbi:hypothetical protein GQX73_g202 [Xylaria multiplex]|uniref:Uncharacterized protein n=1 Tax=Xylaria multiplex TaxID=323545 RepID=A0A7C8MYD5_9PEZI|nr:hypothetical protein GQX73_g202 [Xylaria multiplex]